MRDPSVTRRALSLGARDSWNGWCLKVFTPSTIDMPIVPGGATRLALEVGVKPSIYTMGYSASVVVAGDQILDAFSDYWEVETVEKVNWLDSHAYYKSRLGKLSMWQAEFGTTTWIKSRGSDARYRTKYWMDQKLRATQITKDDDSTQADFAVMFSDPPYSMEFEFRGTKNLEGIYILEHPNSTALRDGDQIIRDYEEHVPIHIFAINSTGCSGDALANKMHKELRYICQEYPEGSQRNLETQRRHRPVDLGGMQLFHLEEMLSYTRDVST